MTRCASVRSNRGNPDGGACAVLSQEDSGVGTAATPLHLLLLLTCWYVFLCQPTMHHQGTLVAKDENATIFGVAIEDFDYFHEQILHEEMGQCA